MAKSNRVTECYLLLRRQGRTEHRKPLGECEIFELSQSVKSSPGLGSHWSPPDSVSIGRLLKGRNVLSVDQEVDFRYRGMEKIIECKIDGEVQRFDTVFDPRRNGYLLQ